MNEPTSPVSVTDEFYQFYLTEHSDINCRRLHFLGTSFGVLGIAQSLRQRSIKPIAKGLLLGYGCAWIGHFFFEKNKPATFKYPLQSFKSDWRMYADIWRGKVSITREH